MKAIEPILNDIGTGTIENFHIDNNNNEIVVHIKGNNGNLKTLRFKDIKGYYFMDISDSNNLNLDDYISDLNTVSYYKSGFGRFANVNMNNPKNVNVSIPNFAINLINSSIFIEAETIEIDEESYKVNFPN